MGLTLSANAPICSSPSLRAVKNVIALRTAMIENVFAPISPKTLNADDPAVSSTSLSFFFFFIFSVASSAASLAVFTSVLTFLDISALASLTPLTMSTLVLPAFSAAPIISPTDVPLLRVCCMPPIELLTCAAISSIDFLTASTIAEIDVCTVAAIPSIGVAIVLAESADFLPNPPKMPPTLPNKLENAPPINGTNFIILARDEIIVPINAGNLVIANQVPIPAPIQ